MSKLTSKSVVSAGNMKMPIVGLGTWQLDDNVTNGVEALELALEAGYRHIDTAYVYKTEPVIGRTINHLISSGKYTREEIFLVTKLPSVGNRPELVEKFLEKSLADLGMDYVDLYLIHWPVGMVYSGENLFPVDSEGNMLVDMDTDIVAVWKAMEKQVDAGRAKAIGLSNFNIGQIQRILKEARIPPANLQVELHVYFQQQELLSFCKDNNITICAYAPLGSPGLVPFNEKNKIFNTEGISQNALADPVVVKVAEKHSKTPGQVLLRFLLELGVAVIPKSTNPQRIKSNIDLFDFEFSAEEMKELRGLDRGEKGRLFGSNLLRGLKKHPECPF